MYIYIYYYYYYYIYIRIYYTTNPNVIGVTGPPPPQLLRGQYPPAGFCLLPGDRKYIHLGWG